MSYTRLSDPSYVSVNSKQLNVPSVDHWLDALNASSRKIAIEPLFPNYAYVKNAMTIKWHWKLLWHHQPFRSSKKS